MTVVGCSIFKTRPVQEMSNTSAALKAAKEVQADILAPVLYREAMEWFQKAKAEYKLKNFQTAEEYALKARGFAEQAEFEVIKGGGQRAAAPEEAPPAPAPTPYDYPTPTPTPFSQMQSQDPNAGQPRTEASASPTPTSDNSSSPSFFPRRKP